MRVTIDGVDYLPADQAAPKPPRIGVAITTRNRPDQLAETLTAFKAHSPEIPIIIVDDGSTTPVTADTTVIRHDISVGIPGAKNRCITELMKLGVDHLFLFDDDTRPAQPDWWRPYVESPEHHLQYSWTHFANGKPVDKMAVRYSDDHITAYGWSMGCMLYADRTAIETVGGMREEFAPAMHEHIEWSRRIHAAGLTTFTHQDITGSEPLIHATDRHRAVQSSINLADRKRQLERNDRILASLEGDTSFVNYQPRDIILTCLFTGQGDPQRPRPMRPDPKLADALLKSLNGRDVVVLCDFDTNHPNFVRVPAGCNPYIQRWISYRRYLIQHPEVRYLWCVDATDVESLADPFPIMRPNTLFAGWENQIVGCPWMRDNHPASLDWINTNTDRPLINAGVLGGDRQTILQLCARIISMWSENNSDLTDMGYVNRAAETMNLVTGPRITTLFKANERNAHSLWKHK